MVPTRDRIRLTGIALDAIHGVHEFERQTPQRFVVDVTLQLQRSASDDDLTTTVDYSVLAGHTDNKGSRGYNVRLSQKRAESVRDYLVSKGIAADRMVAKGYGPDKPLATNDTEEGRAQNRRTELSKL